MNAQKQKILKNRINYKSHKKYKSVVPDWLIDDWKKYQCPDCRKGDRSKCSANKKNMRAFREDEKGKIHYYCFMGCLMLELLEKATPEDVKKFIESQFNVDGHYEKLANP
ncbi:MAG: hypothetical protein NTY68_01555 [Candidatus Micrarchaeota archaeon]|nr:hypothetical protein [Candidatus Micrarchaeota archaeon]